MEIKQGTILLNRTQKYLRPCLKEYGLTFRRKFETITRVAYGVGDIILDNVEIFHKKHVFVLIDTKIKKLQFIQFMSYIVHQPFYETDYAFDDITTGRFHMLVLKIPEKFDKSLGHWIKGRYSQMYSKKEIDDFFEDVSESKKILTLDRSYKAVFLNKINDIFKTTVLPGEYHGELDLPPKKADETFNYNYLKQTKEMKENISSILEKAKSEL